MMNKLVAYDLTEVRKKRIVATAKDWYKSGVLTQPQWEEIKNEYISTLYSPSPIIRILLFLAAQFGLSTLIGIIVLMFSDMDMIGIQVASFIVGGLIVFFTEKGFIQDQKHYKSGVTSAGVYVGYSFIYFSVLGESVYSEFVYISWAFVLLSWATIRYLDILTIIPAIGCFVALLFLGFEPYIAVLPFIIMFGFTGLFLLSQFIQKRADVIIWEDHFIIFDTVALLLVYVGGNYFVVRELSLEMMGLELANGEDIPFAFLFYGFTVLIPIFYLYWGIIKKSVLFIRVSLLTLALAAFTLKYYFSLGHPEISITISGAILIVIAIALMKHLKIIRNGFTRNPLLTNKWDNQNMTAFIASQTLGGHSIKDKFSGKGGEFGGGGASGDF